MQQSAKSRVTVDFPLPERDILQLLCEQDYRLPQEQIRWLVINAARERGLNKIGSDMDKFNRLRRDKQLAKSARGGIPDSQRKLHNDTVESLTKLFSTAAPGMEPLTAVDAATNFYVGVMVYIFSIIGMEKLDAGAVGKEVEERINNLKAFRDKQDTKK